MSDQPAPLVVAGIISKNLKVLAFWRIHHPLHRFASVLYWRFTPRHPQTRLVWIMNTFTLSEEDTQIITKAIRSRIVKVRKGLRAVDRVLKALEALEKSGTQLGVTESEDLAKHRWYWQNNWIAARKLEVLFARFNEKLPQDKRVEEVG